MPYTYYAFISYSRKDKAAARYLQNQLESYRYPAVLVDAEHRPEDPKYLRKVFRDTSDLDVTRSDFTEAIDRHIAESRYLIVLCSPDSQKSVWVDREIVSFLETHDNNPRLIFPVILEGNVPDCLPEKLRTPEFLNRNLPTMIPDDASSRKAGWEHGFLQLVGCLLNVSIAKITDRYQKAKQAALRRIVFATSAALAVAVGLTVWALAAEQKAKVAEQKARHEAKIAKTALNFVNDAFNAADATKSGDKDMTLLEFARTTSDKLDKVPVPEVKLKLAEMILPLLGNMGDRQTALARLLTLLPEAEQIYPDGSLERGGFYLKLALLLMQNGRYDEAAEYYLKSLKMIRQRFGDDHPVTARSLGYIGTVYSAKGEYDKAIEYYRQELAILRKKFGDNHHPVTANVLNNIGIAYKSKGEYDKAIEYYKKSLAIKRKKLGGDHPGTADTLNNIGNAYSSKGEYDKAIEYYQQALAINRKKLGYDHPSTAMALNNIGFAYKYKGEYDKAIEYYQQALAIKRKKLGYDHPSTAYTLNNIGNAYSSKGEYDKAIEYYKKSLAIKRKKLGGDHPSTAETETGLGYSLVMTGKEAEGLKLLDHALAARRKKLGDDHPDTAETYHFSGLARLELASRNKSADALKSAEEYLRNALAVRKEKFGSDHSKTKETIRTLEQLKQIRSENK